MQVACKSFLAASLCLLGLLLMIPVIILLIGVEDLQVVRAGAIFVGVVVELAVLFMAVAFVVVGIHEYKIREMY